jgi:repressor LexA
MDKLTLWRNKKKNLGLTNQEIANRAGLPLRTVEQIMCGKVKNPRLDTVQAIDRALGVSIESEEEKKYPPIEGEIDVGELDMYPVPLVGRVVAGMPIESEENIEGYVYINHKPKEEYFALRVWGDSMINAGIPDGAILIVHKQAYADSGNIVVAFLNGEQTVKYFKNFDGDFYLYPANLNYQPIPIKTTDDFLILGRVIEIRILGL